MKYKKVLSVMVLSTLFTQFGLISEVKAETLEDFSSKTILIAENKDGQNQATTANDTMTSAQKKVAKYKEAINNIGNYFQTPYREYSNPRYTLLDLDQDNIPELLLSQQNQNYSYEVEILQYNPSTDSFIKIKNDDMLGFGVGGAGGFRGGISYLRDKHALYSFYFSSGTGYGTESIITVSNGKLKKQEKDFHIFNTPKEERFDPNNTSEELIWYDINDIAPLQNLETILEAEEVKIIFNGKLIVPNKTPYITHGRTFVPLRTFSEKMTTENSKSSIYWNQETRTVTVQIDDINYEFRIDENMYTKISEDGTETIPMDAKVTIKNGTTFVPLRVISEIFGYKVDYDINTKTVLVESK